MSLYDIDDKTGIDEYGVDHSNFSLHDEIAYNMQRAREKEQQQSLMSPSQQPVRISNTNNFVDSGEYYIKDDKNYAWDMPKQTATIPSTQSLEPSLYRGVPTAAVTGAVEGIFGGLERVANGTTFGVYGNTVDEFLNNAYTNRQNKLQNQAQREGLGYANKLSNRFIDIGSQALRKRGLGF